MLHSVSLMFKKRENIAEIEEGKLLSPKFDNDGLIPVDSLCQYKRSTNARLYECGGFKKNN